MADDWEDWEKEDFDPPAVKPAAAVATEAETVGQALLKSLEEPDMSRFADEDKEEESQPTTHQTTGKPKEKKDKKSAKTVANDQPPLDDPVAEKLRQQRLVEESDYKATRDLFGSSSKSLDDFLPRTNKDFEEFAQALFDRYMLPHASNKSYKLYVKTVAKLACGPLSKDETKDIETCIAGLRADKLKEEQKKQQAVSKKTLNVGKTGGAAGLDDYIYDEPLDDDADFM